MLGILKTGGLLMKVDSFKIIILLFRQELEDGIRREAEHHRKEMQTLEDYNKAAILRYQEEVSDLGLFQQ